MRKIALLLIPIVIFLTGCDEENNSNPEQSITGNVISQSDCKNFKSTFTENDQSCIQYYYNESSKTLHLTHINTGFNCCPGNISCSVSIADQTVTITEKEEAAMCNCNCLFDINIEVYEVKKADYVIKIVEPYIGDQEKLEFEIDLNDNISGEYCVNRDSYPWGI
jgi:hypothetical protein